MNNIEIKSNEIEAGSEAPVTPATSGASLEETRQEAVPSAARVTLRTLRAETEMQAISHALEQTGWNRKRAAQLLSISYRGLLYKIRQHNITKDQSLSGVPKRPKMADTLNWESSSLAVAGSGAQSKD